MTLEPVVPASDKEDTTELDDFRRRFWWILPLTVVVLLLVMIGYRIGLLTPNRSPGWSGRWRHRLFCGMVGHSSFVR